MLCLFNSLVVFLHEREKSTPEDFLKNNKKGSGLFLLTDMYLSLANCGKKFKDCLIHRHDICQKHYTTAVFGARILRKKCVNRDICVNALNMCKPGH